MTHFQRTASSANSSSAVRARRQQVDLLAFALLICAVTYTAAAIASVPHHLALSDAVDVFAASAVPGVLVSMLLRLAQPTAFDRSRRRRLVGVSLSAAAIVAFAPLLVASS